MGGAHFRDPPRRPGGPWACGGAGRYPGTLASSSSSTSCSTTPFSWSTGGHLATVTCHRHLDTHFRTALTEEQRSQFADIVGFFNEHLTPLARDLAFLLGFYVKVWLCWLEQFLPQVVVGRWWGQWRLLPWPDTLAMQLQVLLSLLALLALLSLLPLLKVEQICNTWARELVPLLNLVEICVVLAGEHVPPLYLLQICQVAGPPVELGADLRCLGRRACPPVELAADLQHMGQGAGPPVIPGADLQHMGPPGGPPVELETDLL